MTENLFDKQNDNYEPSAADLRDEYIIKNTAEYVHEFRNKFLKWARESKSLSLGEVCKKCHITKKDLERIEAGEVTQGDMMALKQLSDLYGLSYQYLMAMYRLIRRPQKSESEYKIAAHHGEAIDANTKKQISEFIMKLKKGD